MKWRLPSSAVHSWLVTGCLISATKKEYFAARYLPTWEQKSSKSNNQVATQPVPYLRSTKTTQIQKRASFGLPTIQGRKASHLISLQPTDKPYFRISSKSRTLWWNRSRLAASTVLA